MSILFVCLGNICRSPLVAAVARRRFADADCPIPVDSCGTG
ncbi:MAG: low molecular weight phosphotyrosine protein phosphatase, partial [Rhodanobacter sp.]|nr:low molecular weight phosphotyrosine protein phosphatase [Rhodanobacter sp.]